MDRQLLLSGAFYTTFSSEDVVVFYCLSISERWGVKFAGLAKVIPLNYLPSSKVIHLELWVLWMSKLGHFGGRGWGGERKGSSDRSIPMTSHQSVFHCLHKIKWMPQLSHS
jgi:hypothetical protein